MTDAVATYGSGIKVTPRVVLPHAFHGRTRADKIRSLAQANLRLIPHMIRTAMAPRDAGLIPAFHAHIAAKGYEFTSDDADSSIPYVAPLLREFAARTDRAIRYMEIGALEGRNLAFLDWLLPARLDVTVIDPWFDEEFNPDGNYHAIEDRFRRNMARASFPAMTLHKGFSGTELPRLRAEGQKFDLIYVDGSHAAIDVITDMGYCASMLAPGGMMILDDSWHDIAEIGGPGVKQAVDNFLRVFGRYFEVKAVYRQVALVKTDEIPR
jgi:hypothetical protein